MFSSQLTTASIVPRRVDTVAAVRAAIALDGAAVFGGLHTEADAIAFASKLLGDKYIRVGRQFEATARSQDAEAAVVDEQPVDKRGRKRYFDMSPDRMTAHNDGFAFGDYAPDYLFLWCKQPALPSGGDSFLIDAVKLTRLLALDPSTAELADFCWSVDIDHSEPNFQQSTFSPIARTVASGREQARYHPFLAPIEGESEDAQWPMVRRWSETVTHVRDSGPMFRAEAGEMICIDNYRVLHGRDGYTDPNRELYSIWGWSTEAVAVPQQALDIVQPDLAALAM
ncbi:TauD/TfdA family dioxygenase [Rhodococcus globerulus]|uniref:TauD/TfdA family dioxygenase n=1 Tax=Rhodococcus globerulus TaxID=33008 RepID=UPI0039E78DBE